MQICTINLQHFRARDTEVSKAYNKWRNSVDRGLYLQMSVLPLVCRYIVENATQCTSLSGISMSCHPERCTGGECHKQSSNAL